jgi:ribose/xylose/arabinose/galactoside ABC-type transport system permease subunit
LLNQQKIAQSGFFETRAGKTIARNWALFFLLAMTVVFGFAGPGFFDIVNFQNILHLSTGAFLLAAAETLIVITGGIDLSVGYVYGLSSVLGAKVMQLLSHGGMQPWESILLGCLASLSVSLIPGMLNGIFITRFRVPSFIATMGMWGICNGVTLFLADGFMPVMGAPEAINKIGNGFLLYIDPAKSVNFFSKPSYIAETNIRQLSRLIPNSIFLTLIVLLSIGFLLRRTRFGKHIYAIGGSMDAAIRSGINVKRNLVVIYTLSSFLAGLAGLFNLFQTGIGNYTPSGANYELLSVAAVVIGGASLTGGKGRILGTAVGVLVLAVLENGLQIVGVSAFYRYIGVGVLLTIAVVIDRAFPDLF